MQIFWSQSVCQSLVILDDLCTIKKEENQMNLHEPTDDATCFCYNSLLQQRIQTRQESWLTHDGTIQLTLTAWSCHVNAKQTYKQHVQCLLATKPTSSQNIQIGHAQKVSSASTSLTGSQQFGAECVIRTMAEQQLLCLVYISACCLWQIKHC